MKCGDRSDCHDALADASFIVAGVAIDKSHHH